MKRVYLETSAINHAFIRGIAASEFFQQLDEGGLIPTLGGAGIFELAQVFLESRNESKAAALFQFIQELDPSHAPGVANLLDQEVIRLRTGAAVFPFLDHIGQASIKTEIGRLALGHFDARARQFLEGKLAKWAGEVDRAYRSMISQLDRIGLSQKEVRRHTRTFTEFLSAMDGGTPNVVFDTMAGRVTRTEASEMSMRLATFPALRATVYGNLYLNFIMVLHHNRPGKDKVRDLQHVIEASYCDIFCTQDRQLRQVASDISPNLETISLESLLEETA